MIFAIISIIFMIIIHEFGHFSMGKLLKVPVYEFSIGMGPLLWKKQGNSETQYSIRALPIGGFCSFDKGDSSGIQDVSLNKEPIWKRIIIFFGGSGFNILSAILVACILCGTVGTPSSTLQIESIGMEETDEFLQPNDTIIRVNDKDMVDLSDVEEAFKASDGTVNMTVLRDGEEVSSDIKLVPSGDTYIMGVVLKTEYAKSKGLAIVSDGFSYAFDLSSQILSAFGNIFTGKTKMNQMSGIVGAVAQVGEATSQNILNLFLYFVMLSLNLGIFNLLPIPVLDGSKILFCIYEAIFKKRIPEKVEENLTLVFAVLLIVFMIVITVSDISKIL